MKPPRREYLIWIGAIGLALVGVALFTLWDSLWLPEHREKIDLVVAGIDVIAFIAALAAIAYALEHAHELKELRDSLSNRFIGLFPDHLGEITKRIAEAERTVEILADCVDYGSFRPEAHGHLLDAMYASLGKQVKFSIVIWGPAQAMSRANKYRSEDVRKSDPKFKESVRAYLSVCEYDNEFWKDLPLLFAAVSGPQLDTDLNRVQDCIDRNDASDEKAFHALQLCKHEQVQRKLLGFGADIFQYKPTAADDDIDFDLYLWIFDRHTALYALPSEGRYASLFYTADPSVVSALVSIFEQKKTKAERAGAKLVHISTA